MKNLLIFFGVIILVVAALAGSFVWDAYFKSPAENADQITITIDPGSSVDAIADQLAGSNIVASSQFFKLFVKINDKESDFQPGKYVLKKGMSYADVTLAMTAALANEAAITVPEGYTLRQIGELLEENGLVAVDEWLAVVGDPAVDYDIDETALRPRDFSDEFEFLSSKLDNISLEGYLFPDTYRFFLDASAEEIAERMLRNFEDKISEEMLNEIEVRGRTLHQVITMASIVEREVRTEGDRALVADLFWRRLGVGMALQADSTVNYVTGKTTPSISSEDREIDSAWNTYLYPGLPPSPISNPGIAAIEAAIYPEANDYWYFLTDEEGEVRYAKTNDEHNENRRMYLD